MLRTYYIFFVLLSASLLSGCDQNNNFKETDSGLQYRIITDAEGTTAEPGGGVVAHIKYQNALDTLNTFENVMPLRIDLSRDIYQENTLEEGITKLSEGDSAIIRVKNKNFYLEERNMPLPEGLNPEDYTDIHVKIIQVLTEEEAEQAAEEREVQQQQQVQMQIEAFEEAKDSYLDSAEIRSQINREEKIMRDWLEQRQADYEKTEPGVFLIIEEKGSTPTIKKGDEVLLDFEASLLNDSTFLSSQELGSQQFSIIAGYPQFILGWHEAITYFGEGGKGKILIASPLAYGSEGIQGRVPPDQPVIFDISVKAIEEN